MSLVEIFGRIDQLIGLPAVFIFLIVGIILTLKTGFIQIRAFPRFLSILKKGGFAKTKEKNIKTISSIRALFASMATTLGMGNIIGPSMAILAGGPGALFWLVIYVFFGGVTRFTEVTFALHTRTKTEDGKIIGGPIEYLKLVSKWVANWYGLIMVGMFAVLSGLQANTLAAIFAQESSPTNMFFTATAIKIYTGLALAAVVIAVLHGGAKRVGFVASKLVPIMCFSYISFALLIIFQDLGALKGAIGQIFSGIFSPPAAIGGFIGATIFTAMRAGIYRSIYITEAGLGISAIPHSMSDAKRPTDQGILAMFSILADATLSFMSGILVIITGIWKGSAVTSTLMYQIFKMKAPGLGQFVLLVSLTLFVLTTVIGNSFNGTQSFASFTKHKWTNIYKIFTVFIIFFSALMEVPLIWALVNILITLVAVPNVIGLVILAFKKPEVLEYKSGPIEGSER